MLTNICIPLFAYSTWIVVPTTLDEYCIKWAPEKDTVEEIESENFWYDDDDDDDDMDSEDYEDDWRIYFYKL